MLMPFTLRIICLLTFFQTKHFHIYVEVEITKSVKPKKNIEAWLNLEIAIRGLQEMWNRIIKNQAYVDFVRSFELRAKCSVNQLDCTGRHLYCSFLRNY